MVHCVRAFACSTDAPLEIVFCFDWNDERCTVSVLEVMLDLPSDFVLLLDSVGDTLLVIKRSLEVIFCCDLLACVVDELQREVSHNP